MEERALSLNLKPKAFFGTCQERKGGSRGPGEEASGSRCQKDTHPSVPWGTGARTAPPSHGHQAPRTLKPLTVSDLNPQGQPSADGSEVC